MGEIVKEKSKMLVEISKIRNLNSDYTLELIISLKQSINRELLDIIDKYLQINDQKDIKIKVSRKDDMSIIGNKEDDELPFVKRYKIEDKDLPF
jgi:septum formation topological specificity factor MinE